MSAAQKMLSLSSSSSSEYLYIGHSMMESDQSQERKSSAGCDPLALALLNYCESLQLFKSHLPLLPNEGIEWAGPWGPFKL